MTGKKLPDLPPEEFKAAVKEALTEWLDAQFALFGKYSLAALSSLFFAWLIYLYFLTHGFKNP